MQNIYAVILAGGKGLRLQEDYPKQFRILKNRPIIAWSLEKFNKLSEISAIITVIPPDYKEIFDKIVNNSGISKQMKTVSGGETRQGSSYNAVMSMNFNDNDILIFHDAARPFISEEIIRKCIDETQIHGASGVYIKSIDTLAEIESGFVKKIPQREAMYRTQTPQCFKYEIIRAAHENANLKKINDATDDASLVIDAGYKIKIVDGDSRNIKITTPDDMDYAEFLAGRL